LRQFHRENNIARELETVISTFFTGGLRRETMRGIKHYYDAINAAAGVHSRPSRKAEVFESSL